MTVKTKGEIDIHFKATIFTVQSEVNSIKSTISPSSTSALLDFHTMFVLAGILEFCRWPLCLSMLPPIAPYCYLLPFLTSFFCLGLKLLTSPSPTLAKTGGVKLQLDVTTFTNGLLNSYPLANSWGSSWYAGLYTAKHPEKRRLVHKGEYHVMIFLTRSRDRSVADVLTSSRHLIVMSGPFPPKSNSNL